MKKTMITCFLCTVVMFGLTATFNSSLWAGSPETIVVKLRVYEGFRPQSDKTDKAVSSHFLKPLALEDVQSDTVVANESKTLKRVFNLKEIKFISADFFILPLKGKMSPAQSIVLNGRKFIVQVATVTGENDKFSVDVFEGKKPKEKQKSLLRTRILLPSKKSTALGFEDSMGHIYFLSFNRPKDVDKFLSSNPVNIRKIQKPQLIKRVEPKYPEVAKDAGIGGTVVVDAVTDIYGRVVNAVVINGHPLLRRAAVEALKQWVYEPYIVDGKPRPVKFTVVMKFNLDKATEKEAKPLPISFSERPEPIKKTQPKYPQDALKARIQGNVTIELTNDANGNVVNAVVIEGHPLLRQAAVDSVKNWKYPPFVKNGRNISIRFTVVVKFRLK
jgi:TonB family protein